MKSKNLLLLLMTSSIVTYNAYASNNFQDDIESYSVGNNSCSTESSEEDQPTVEYQFEILGDIFKPQHQSYQAKFRITSQNADNDPLDANSSILDTSNMNLQDFSIKTLPLIDVKPKGFKVDLLASINSLQPFDPLPKKWGTARENVALKFAYEGHHYRMDFTRPKEYQLHGNWQFREDLTTNQTIATLTLRALLNGQNWQTVHQREIKINHELIRREAEVPGQLYFDGDIIYQAKTQVVHYRDPRTKIEYSRNIQSRDGEIPSHQGKNIVYVEPFSIGNSAPQPKDAYIGPYDRIERVGLSTAEKLPGREEDRLIYSDGTYYYKADITQEIWKRGNDKTGFFIASYKPDNKLNFIPNASIGNGGSIPRGLYQLSSVLDKENKRIERWKKLGDQSKSIETSTPFGILSIPGMGMTAPYVLTDTETDEKMLKLKAKIAQIKEIIVKNRAQLVPNTDSYVIFGKAGRGKTTFLHALAGIDLSSRQDGEDEEGHPIYRIDPTNPEDRLPGLEIGHGLTAGTKIPGVYYHKDLNINLVDCPGFEDPGDDEDDGALQDLVNGYSIEQVFPGANAKLFVAISKQDLSSEGNRMPSILLTLDKMTKLFTDDHELQQALYLVVTHKTRGPLTTNQLRALWLKNPPIFQQNPRVKSLFAFLVNNSRVIEFHKPNGPGHYPFDQQEALAKLQKTPSVPNPHFQLTFEEKPKLLAVDLAKKLNDYLTDYIKVEGAQRIINYCRNLIDLSDDSINDLRSKLSKIVTKLKSLQQDNVTPDKFLKRLGKFIDIETVKRVVEDISFLKNKVKNDIAFDIARWANAFNTAIQQIETLAAAPTPDITNGVLSLKGALVAASDVNTALHTATQPISSINLFGLNTVLLDADVTRHGTTLSIIAPCWKILKVTTLNISGNVGSSGVNGANGGSGQAGGDGSPGMPGGNGGHFYGRGSLFKHLDRLTVLTNGGNGGSGGNGGNGGNGPNGQNGDSASIVNRTAPTENPVSYNLSHLSMVSGLTPHQGTLSGNQTVYISRATDGTVGGDGGKGAQGGLGGLKGSSVIEGVDWTSTPQDGQKGVKGTPGQGGTGGSHGTKTYKGTYLTGLHFAYETWEKRGFPHFNTKIDKHNDDWGNRWKSEIEGCNQVIEETRQGKASDGRVPGVDDLSQVAPTSPASQLSAAELQTKRKDILKAYSEFYFAQAALPDISPFVKVFPNIKFQ